MLLISGTGKQNQRPTSVCRGRAERRGFTVDPPVPLMPPCVVTVYVHVEDEHRED